MTSRTRPKAQGSSSRPTPSASPTSFLFIVNEVQSNDNPEHEGSVPERYVDGRWRPPNVERGFFAQAPGYVYRWYDGVVSYADDYGWSAREVGEATIFADGTIYKVGEEGTVWPELYRAATVFYCNPFDLFFTARGDVTVRNLSGGSPEDDWQALTFRHDRRQGRDGGKISRAEHAGDQAHVAVHTASWIDQLIPTSYRRTSSNETRNKGLAGLLSIVISLIAFSCVDHEVLHDVLIQDRAWSGHHWIPHGRTSGQVPRRGVITSVYYDPENPEGSTRQSIYDVEYGNNPIFR